MNQLNLPQDRSRPLAILGYTMAVLSVAGAMIVAELLTRLFHAEAIVSSMLCAVIFTAWFGGFGPSLLAITLAVLAFHHYLLPPINSFAWKTESLDVGDASSIPVRHFVAHSCARDLGTNNSNTTFPAIPS